MTSTIRGNDGFDSAQYLELRNTYSWRNKIINGGFDIWQRGITQTTTNGYASDDRWFNGHIGSGKTHTRQTFTLGQTEVPGNPKYYSRTVVTSVAGANNSVVKSQRIEGVQTFAGQRVTISFYAKANSNKNIAIELVQVFGTGGSPSSSVVGIQTTKIALATEWFRFDLQLDVPSIIGKTLGTEGDDYLGVNFWFDAGSNLDVRTDSLGQQSGTFDIANVQLEAGSKVTEFECKHIGETLASCKRYYEIVQWVGIIPSITTNMSHYVIVPHTEAKRIIPTHTLTVQYRTGTVASETVAYNYIDRCYVLLTNAGAAQGISRGYVTADAEL